MGLLCRFGWHAWTTWHAMGPYKLQYEDERTYEQGEVIQRECRRCSDLQRKRVKS